MGEDDKGRVVESKVEREASEKKDAMYIKVGYGLMATLTFLILVTMFTTLNYQRNVNAVTEQIENYEPFKEGKIANGFVKWEALKEYKDKRTELAKKRKEIIEGREDGYTQQVEKEGDKWRTAKNRNEELLREVDQFEQEISRILNETETLRQEMRGG